MPQSLDRRFQRLSERLLAAGIAPHHVRRYTRELSDHFDDLMRAERADGTPHELAETHALARLGNEDDLAQAMLAKPGLRSITARYPLAVFGLGPLALLVLSMVGGVFLEIWLLNHTGPVFRLFGLLPSPSSARIATKIYTAYNTLVVFGAPLLFAWAFYWLGTCQRMSQNWIIAGVAFACVLGGFQNLVFYDTGCRGCGVLLIQSGLVSPFVHYTANGLFSPFPLAQGVARAMMNLAIAGCVWWLARRKAATAMELHTA